MLRNAIEDFPTSFWSHYHYQTGGKRCLTDQPNIWRSHGYRKTWHSDRSWCPYSSIPYCVLEAGANAKANLLALKMYFTNLWKQIEVCPLYSYGGEDEPLWWNLSWLPSNPHDYVTTEGVFREHYRYSRNSENAAHISLVLFSSYSITRSSSVNETNHVRDQFVLLRYHVRLRALCTGCAIQWSQNWLTAPFLFTSIDCPRLTVLSHCAASGNNRYHIISCCIFEGFVVEIINESIEKWRFFYSGCTQKHQFILFRERF